LKICEPSILSEIILYKKQQVENTFLICVLGDIVHQFGAPEDEEEEGGVALASEEPTEATAVNVAAESLSLPISAFEHPRPTESSTQHPSHPHHNHHHHGYHHATHLEVAHEKLHPAHEGAEVSYHENLVNPEQSQSTTLEDKAD
jgi:hypothetical protein